VSERRVGLAASRGERIGVREASGHSMQGLIRALQRRLAPALFRALLAGQLLFGLGEKDAQKIVSMVVRALSAEPALTVEAVGLADAGTGQAVKKVDRPALLAAAVRLGVHRLVDAVRLGES
jgi:pantoate--beta-alanine ligase